MQRPRRYTVVIASSKTDHLVDVEEITAHRPIQAMMRAMEKLNAFRISMPHGRAYDTWTLIPAEFGPDVTKAIAWGNGTRIMWRGVDTLSDGLEARIERARKLLRANHRAEEEAVQDGAP